jgi:Fic family protein
VPNPPFELTPRILSLALEIQNTLGELRAAPLVNASVKLRKENQIKTIHHSLAIEGNSLTTEQITALLENKRVLGPKKQIREVSNAISLYEQMEQLDPFSEKDFLKAHSILLQGLVEKSGAYRGKSVGILKGTHVGHIAPPANRVPLLMRDLFQFLRKRSEVPLLIKACVFHYELEFIHPFMDGNGRIGRLWQQLILMRHSSIFGSLAIESLIHRDQKQYYKILERSDQEGQSTAFIEFCLELIREALDDFERDFRPRKATPTNRIEMAHEHFKDSQFTRKDYLNLHKTISTATASRDLAHAVASGTLSMTGDKALSRYRFKLK